MRSFVLVLNLNRSIGPREADDVNRSDCGSASRFLSGLAFFELNVGVLTFVL